MGGCGTSNDALDRSRAYYDSANYFQAYEELRLERERSPGDPAVERAYLEARRAYLLELAQRLVFDDRELEAIGALQQVLTLDPGNAIAERWLTKARVKLASRTVEAAERKRASDKLDEALILYSDALGYVPEYPPALAGVGFVRDDWARRRAKANDRYLMGVRALAEQLFGQTWYHMGIALENDPGLDPARDGQQAAERRLIENRFDLAMQMEVDGYYGAALMDYLECKKRAPDLAGIDERIERMQRETKAQDLALRAELEMARSNYAQARKLLDEAWEITQLERATVTELLVALDERELSDAYDRARDLDYQNRKEQALAGYQAIDKRAPEGFRDVKARISSLESDLDIAGKAMLRGNEAEQSGDLAAALDAYQEALLIYPGYQDLGSKVEELRKQLAERGGSEESGEAGVQAPPKEEPAKEEPAKEEPAKEEAPKEELPKQEPAKQEPPKEGLPEEASQPTPEGEGKPEAGPDGKAAEPAKPPSGKKGDPDKSADGKQRDGQK